MERDPVKTITLEDVARDAGVSRALVSMAIRDVPGVNSQTRDRILATAERLGYRPNRLASRLASRSTTAIGVFLLDLRQDVYADMFDGIRDVTQDEKLHLVLAVGAHDGTLDGNALDSLMQSRVDIVIATGLLLPDDDVRAFSRHTPIVSVARQIDGVDSVASDNVRGALLATEHLIGLGHRRIVFLANPQTDGYTGRQEGYVDTMTRAGLEPWLVGSQYSRRQAARDIAPVLALPVDERPTAVFAHNDQAALGVLDAMATLGLRAPDDISVVGYDNSQVSQAPGTQLTTVDIHGEELGEEAARMALRRLEEPSAPPASHVSQPTLVVRATSGPARF
ncbi:LacI family DNA-binding transcriptional regulator [Tessaracoccus caeni]|uniref:LacI family DNA-binding transcriptional regulator n=1 Tax=Tessaracoccus caeni TaxID=3031239 RepID=UPI0023DC98E8|nr:LacI family DNA-binding transcriptional regulator [Tessaracoccus caeni]MDF1488062.1 LacI family DNA-binding transcriptional regulator [Tessaracoccus caeni]